MVHPEIATLPVDCLTGVSTPISRKLNTLGIWRIFDLVLHLPRDYEDKSRIVPIAKLEHGMSCLVSGAITNISAKNGLSVILTDKTGSMTLKFFKTYPSLLSTMSIGTAITAFGEAKISYYGIQMNHPEYHITDSKVFEQALIPIYPTVKGLHQNKLRQLIKTALHHLNQTNAICHLDHQDIAHSGVMTLSHLPDIYHALYAIHCPDSSMGFWSQSQLLNSLKTRTHPSFRRLILEELTAHQLAFLFRRENIYQQQAPCFHANSKLANRLQASLPFELTGAQRRVIQETIHDMTNLRPMLRLVQGDVGAGKTLVCAMCACYAIDSGWQVTIMAPTEILAEQHFVNFDKWFSPLGIRIGFMAGKLSAKQKRQNLQQIATGQVDIVIGTHALFYDGVIFAKLGLCVIDEQHRFGVEQRLRLANKGNQGIMPHQLAMTATPIPRTLAMSLYGDMDISVIDELPPNRTPIITATINRNRRDEVLARIANNCQQGKQAYWVCPLVEESDTDIQSAQNMYNDIVNQLDIQAGLVHGKMPSEDKQAVMNAFKAGDIDLLIATTVIEVGVDVPNASLMVIENAERLGLSQLHQLRGRVGRGHHQSFCILLYQEPLSATAIERLNVIKATTDGFLIAESDLKMRGAGELLGVRQAGDAGYYIADIVRDEAILLDAKKIAHHLLQNNKQKALAMTKLWLSYAQDYVHA